MSGDLYAYLSGHIPGGVILLLIGLTAFSMIWGFTWNRTRFWSFGRFIAVLIFGWVTITGIYAVAWKRGDAPPMPIRVIVLTLNEDGEPINNWRFRAVADLIERRLTASPKHYVLQKQDFTPILTRYKLTPEKLDSLAFLLKARWQIMVTQTADGDYSLPAVKIRQYKNDKYHEVGRFSMGEDAFIDEAVSLIGDVLQTLNDKTPPLGPYGLPPNLEEEVFADLYNSIIQRDAEVYDSSRALLEGLIEKYPGWARPRQELAAFYLDHYASYHKDEIHSQLLKAIEIDPTDPESFILLTRYFLRFANWFEAESAVKLARNLTRDDPRVFYFISRLGRWRLINMPLLTKNEYRYLTLNLAPGFEDARLALAEAYREELDRTSALHVLNQGLEIEPESFPLLIAKTANLVELDRNEEAVVICERLLELKPGNSTVLYNLGVARLYMGQLELAISLFDSSYRNDGTIENLYYAGVAYEKMGNWEKAIEKYQRRMINYEDYFDQVAVSARMKIKLLKRWIVTRDSLKALENEKTRK